MGLDLPEAEAATGVGPLRRAPRAGGRPLRQQLYESVRAAGRISRTELARDLQVSPGSVTPLVSELIGAGLLQEIDDDAAPSGRGRPPVTLGVAPGAGHVAGVKLADHEASAVLIDMAGAPVASARTPRDAADRSPASAVALVGALIDRLAAEAGIARSAIGGLGLGLPGIVDHHAGRLRWSPILAGRDLDLAHLLSDALGLPATVDNDANCLTMAELWFGRGRSLPDFAVVTIEYGVGMGLVVDHAPYRGAHGMGMELGHTVVAVDGALCRCGRRGCLEAYVADYALVREAAVALNGPLPPRGEVLEALHAQAKDGNAAARAIFERAGQYLALGLANVANLFDPRRIILSGSRMRYDLLWAEDVLSEMGAMVLTDPPPVEVNAWDDLVWARGAAALALSEATPRLLA